MVADAPPTRAPSFAGRRLLAADLQLITETVAAHGGLTRQELASLICRRLGWRRPNGGLPIRAAASLLTRLHERGLVTLPPPRRVVPGGPRPVVPRGPGVSPPGLEWSISDALATGLTVRRMRRAERESFLSTVEQHHYLGFREPVGESVWHVAEAGGHWLALLIWASPALHCTARDAWVGWEPAERRRGLRYVANNVRFLVLPWARGENVASRVLSQSVRRLSSDWEQAFGHGLLLAETFVDRSRFAGTCYRASNWMAVGQTRGFGKRGETFFEHGVIKEVFILPLRRDAVDRLRRGEGPKAAMQAGARRVPMFDVSALPMAGQEGLFDVLGRILDHRKRRGVRHPLVHVLSVATCAVLAGARSFQAIAQWAADLDVEARKTLGATRATPPSEPTIRRVMSSVDAEALETAVGRWLLRNDLLKGGVLAIDGKTLRGSGVAGGRPVHMLSALVHEARVVVAQQPVASKGGETGKVRALLAPLPLQDVVVTGDAGIISQDVARHIAQERGGDYILTVKENQPDLLGDIKDLHLEAFPP